MANQLWILAGGNGSGKSTFFNTRLKARGIYFVNADLIAKEKFPEGTLEACRMAQAEARKLCKEYLQQGTSFALKRYFLMSLKLN